MFMSNLADRLYTESLTNWRVKAGDGVFSGESDF